MAFWGVELKPGKPFTHNFENDSGRLHLSQATLGKGSSGKKTIVQCQVGDGKPIYLCSLLPEKMETCQLNLEFEEDEDVVFSVVGSHRVHLSGFFYGETEDGYGSDLYEEDAAETDSETDGSLEFDYDMADDDEDNSSDDDFDMYPPSPLPNSGVKIEEIVEDKKHTDENDKSKGPKKKKNQSNGTVDAENAERLAVVKSNNGITLLESEDEDGFPISADSKSNGDSVRTKLESGGIKDQDAHEEAAKSQARNDANERKGLKKRARGDTSKDNDNPRGSSTTSISSDKADNVVLENSAKQNKKNKKEKIMDGEDMACEDSSKSKAHPEHVEAHDGPVSTVKTEDYLSNTEKKRKNKNKNSRQDEKAVTFTAPAEQNKSADEVKDNDGGKPSQVRSFGNGLVIEELAMGKPDGKRASPGKKVSVRYIGRLKKNGKIFDSNVGKRPFKFRLGVGQVIKGWDVGVNGMRIGDKRRITIPPAMGYGARGAGTEIPPNAWLVFDVELLDVE